MAEFSDCSAGDLPDAVEAAARGITEAFPWNASEGTWPVHRMARAAIDAALPDLRREVAAAERARIVKEVRAQYGRNVAEFIEGLDASISPKMGGDK